MAPEIKTGKFVVGHCYFRAWLHGPDDSQRISPVVETWVFKGIVGRGYDVDACDIPSHFYHFCRWPGDAGDIPSAVDIPSLEKAEMSLLTWKEFLEEVTHLDFDLTVDLEVEAIKAKCEPRHMSEREAYLAEHLDRIRAVAHDDRFVDAVEWAARKVLGIP